MTSYHQLPLLKGPVWTWEVPAYFFVGGLAGAAAVVAAAGRLAQADERLVRDAQWIAAAGSTASGVLLVSDLGRPERFLYMMRVFKPQSAMSVGAWTLAGFGGSTTAAVLTRGRSSLPARISGGLAQVAAAGTGVVMATYTGVLIGATAIPVWKEHVRMLPALFGASSLGSAVSLLEVLGHRHEALNILGIGTSLFETVGAVAVETGRDRVSEPLRRGRSGMLTRLGSALSGPVPLALRLFGKRRAAAACTIAGSVLTRFGWIEAGKESAKDIGVAL